MGVVKYAYYNEFEPYAAEWLRRLIRAEHIAPGYVDERSILDVSPDDLREFGQCHFFAGLGGWSLALRLAGISDEEPVWTGSCPCQPWSVAGDGLGEQDERHLWPAWFRIVSECRPAVAFGEQVESPSSRRWLAGVRADVESLGYSFGAADLCAAGVAAPHRRQRLFWVADAYGRNASAKGLQRGGEQRQQQENGCDFEGVGDAAREPLRRRRQPWESAVAVECEDGTRRIEPGLLGLVDGVSDRLAKLRAFGNAIVPQVAATFIRAYFEA